MLLVQYDVKCVRSTEDWWRYIIYWHHFQKSMMLLVKN